MTHLRQFMLDELERRNYSPNTVRSYVHAVEDFARYFRRPPEQLGPDHVREYQVHLFRDRKLSARTIAGQTAALRFLFVKTLRRPYLPDALPFPKQHRRLPTVLSQEEVARLIDATGNLMHRHFCLKFLSGNPVTVHSVQGLRPTMAMVRADSSSGGTALLTAMVSPASAGGRVMFLGAGVILGSVPLSANGTASWSGLNVSGAIHNYTASLLPSSAYAPTASPTSRDGWLGIAPQFTLSLDTHSAFVTTSHPASLQLVATGAGAASGAVTVACFTPEDSAYACDVAPGPIGFGTTTT